MLPTFDNIVRLTNHGDASFYGNPWRAAHLTNGHLVIRDFYEEDDGAARFISVPEHHIPEVLNLWSLH